MRQFFLCLIYVIVFTIGATAQDHGHDHSHDGHAHDTHNAEEHAAHGCTCHHEEAPEDYNPGNSAFHHISDQNIYNIGPISFPLPCMLYAPDKGWDMFSSGYFEADAHGNSCKVKNGYIISGGLIRRIVDQNFPSGEVHLEGLQHKMIQVDGKERDAVYACYSGGKEFLTEARSTADGGLFGGGITSFYDFSITKNVLSMLLVCIFLLWIFISAAKKYARNEGQAPSGLQNLLETMFVFIQDEVAKPFLGAKWEKFTPFLMTLFFFVLGLNLFGQIPFFGGSNVSGNLAVTMVLAIVAFFVVNLSGNKNYWEHIFWMPGVPAWIKIILTPVEVLGVFIKPLTLMLRLFANITAGHMVMVIFVGLIFVFGQQQVAPSLGTAVGSTLLTMFMMSIELLVAFIQAFVFTILTASYLGAATEEAHH